MMKNLKKKGFTLIEVMIAVTLFTIIMTIGTGAVLNTNNTYRKTESMRAIIDNLHFVMEDISRNLRVGSNYVYSSPDSITFTAVNGDEITYSLDNQSQDYTFIAKNNIAMSAPKIDIDGSQSGFFVYGADANDGIQPRVTIKLNGMITSKNVSTPFNIQTTVSQRLLD